MERIPRVGDIVRAPSGLLRVVRNVTGGRGNVYVTFVIRHCSWTHRCYTVYTWRELKAMGYVLTGKKWRWVPEEKPLMDLINGTDHTKMRYITCCDVEGIA